MPRAAVHARHDAPLIRHGLASLGLAVPADFKEILLTLHRDLDANVPDGTEFRHAMRARGEPPDVALAAALAHVRDCAALAAKHIQAALQAEGSPEVLLRAGLLNLGMACHAVRDSYSTGHTRRHPRPGGAWIADVRSWHRAKKPQHGFGLAHVLDDIRFEFPLSLVAPEVRASDRAVGALVLLVVRAVERPGSFEAAWEAFAQERFASTMPRAWRDVQGLSVPRHRNA